MKGARVTVVTLGSSAHGWLQSLLRASDDAIIGENLDGIIVNWNAAAERLYGFAADEMVGGRFDPLASSLVDDQPLRRLLGSPAQGGRTDRYRTRHRSRTGLLVDVQVTLSPVYEDGEITGVLRIVRDVTPPSAEPEIVRRNLETYRLTFANSPLPMWLYAVDTFQVLAVNDSALDLYGYSRVQFLALTFDQLYPPDERKTVRTHIQSRPGALTRSRRARHIDANGRGIHVSVTASPLNTPEGMARLVVACDVTQETAANAYARDSQAQLDAALTATIAAIAATLGQRDPYTAGHQRRVADLAEAIAQRLSIDDNTIRGLSLAATIHDIGKIGLPAEILSYPGRLSPTAMELVREHSQIGHDLIAGIRFPWPIAEIILQHHERLDGAGYPLGLRGDAILLESRVLAVADVTEAMSAHRPYRPARGTEAALTELADGRGTRYDPDVVDACTELFEGDLFTFDTADTWTLDEGPSHPSKAP
jgi:PAS domain S-box-containing protein